jgi:hypothetical protein
VPTRVLNMPMGFIAADVRQRYRQHAADAVRQHLPELGAHGFFQNHANGNITPRGTETEVHHDSHHHISTAFGLASRKGRPLKLWLLWPSTELRHLASCYSDTRAALACMDHGSFLYGHTFSTEHWAYEPSTIPVSIGTGSPADEACRSRIDQLRLGLRSNAKLRQACVDQFIETWALEAATFRRHSGLFEQLVAVWAADALHQGSCAWCAATGESELSTSDSREHARAHLDGRLSLTTMNTTAYITEDED